MTLKTIVILSDNNLQSNLIKQQLNNFIDVTIHVVQASDFNDACNRHTVSLVIVDYHYLFDLEKQQSLPDFDLLNINILVYNVPVTDQDPPFAHWRATRGMIFQSACAQHLIDAVNCVLQGGLWIPRRCLEELLARYRDSSSSYQRFDHLTNREKQILNLIATGSSNKQIASALYLSENTVKTHIYKAYKKLNIHCRNEASELVRQRPNSFT